VDQTRSPDEQRDRGGRCFGGADLRFNISLDELNQAEAQDRGPGAHLNHRLREKPPGGRALVASLAKNLVKSVIGSMDVKRRAAKSGRLWNKRAPRAL